MSKAKIAEEATVIIEDDRVDPDCFVTSKFDSSEKPQFTVDQVATVFFAKSPHQIRWHERKKHFILNGEAVMPHRRQIWNEEKGKWGPGARYYTLEDVECMAHALAQQGKLGPERLRHVIIAIEAIAHIYGYFDPPEEPEEDE